MHLSVITRSRIATAALALLLCWLVGASARLLAPSFFPDAPHPELNADGQLLLATQDAYIYAAGLQATLTPDAYALPNLPTPETAALVALGSVAHALGISPESFALYAPVCFAPLIALPLLLLGLLTQQLGWTTLASLLASLGFSYGYRTVVGYFDTDMLTLTYLCLITVALIAALTRSSLRWLSLAAGLAVLATWVHPGSERILAVLTVTTYLYVLIFARRSSHAHLTSLALTLALLPLPLIVRASLLLALIAGALRWLNPTTGTPTSGTPAPTPGTPTPTPGTRTPTPGTPRPARILLIASTLALIAFIATSSAMTLVLLKLHLHPGVGPTAQDEFLLQFPSLAPTIGELARPDFLTLGVRTAGHAALLVTGLIGFALALYRHRPLGLFLPLLALGTLGALTGQRYTIFAVPPLALGNAWLALALARRLAAHVNRLPRRATTALLALTFIAPSLAFAAHRTFTAPPYIPSSPPEIAQLTALRAQAPRNAFLFTWWDVAYAGSYFTGLPTLVDGSKHNADIWLAAEALLGPSQQEAARLARLAAEYAPHHAPTDPVLFHILRDWQRTTGHPVQRFVPTLRSGALTLPPKTREVYLWLPWQLIHSAPAIGSLRAVSGLVPAPELRERHFLAVNILRHDGTLTRQTPWTFDPGPGLLTHPSQPSAKVWKVIDISPNARGALEPTETLRHPDGAAIVLNLRHAELQLFMDRPMLGSVLAQLLFFGAMDRRFFEPISFNNAGLLCRVML